MGRRVNVKDDALVGANFVLSALSIVTKPIQTYRLYWSRNRREYKEDNEVGDIMKEQRLDHRQRHVE